VATRPATPHRQMAAASRPARRDSRRARSYGSPVISSTGSLSRAPPKHTRMPDHRVRQPGPAQNQDICAYVLGQGASRDRRTYSASF